ncbi:MAG TPA: adenylyl-sulfate kinase [Solirubrobacteraceae bacterium]|nr:adenylyl-sulfate kinase [Solirubrobacteraceae bacterium]
MAAVALTGHRELLRLATAGSVDDGKSTLIGRLLLDTGSLLTDHIDDVSRGGALDLAAVTDGLRAEREQGITIDVAYRFFSTARRSFILADTPGHERYTRNMFTGASTADVALILIDARTGVVTQTRRHAHIATLLGVEHIVVLVNKMDLVSWDRGRFEEIVDQVHDLVRRLGVTDLAVIPISALHGDNVALRSDRTPFYDGPTLLEYLEQVDIQADRDLWRLRVPVQWVGRRADGDSRLYMGRVVAGTLEVGDEVLVLPSGVTTTITELDTLDAGVRVAVPPMSVTFGLADRLDVGRGDVLVAPADQPVIARELDCTLCWMSEQPLYPGRRYALKHTSRTVRATVQEITERTDPDTLERHLEPTSLAVNDIGEVRLRTSSSVVADPYVVNRETGAFILIDEDSNDTVAAGVIRTPRAIEIGRGTRRDITWHASALNRDERWLAIDQRGATVLLTGLPASGKSTIAVELERRLVDAGQSAYLLDGDNIRHGLSEDLGFSPGDRSEHIRRVGQVARLMADAGTIALVSLISPLAADRAHLRKAHEQANLSFVEVFVDTPVEECERRDPKGLYARARAGDIKGFTGVDAPYEPPEHPEVRIDTATVAVQDAVSQIIEVLRARPRALAKGATMRISAKADYAVRAAIELAAAPDSETLPGERIATSQGIPLNFLEHILSELRLAGLLSSQRGTEGGYRLAKDPSQITIADIIRAVEGPLATVRGAKPEDAEYPGSASQLPRVWIAVRKNLRSVLEHVTLADVAGATLPDSINRLADDPEAWVTR